MSTDKWLPEKHAPGIVGAIEKMTSAILLLLGGKTVRAMAIVQGHNRWLFAENDRLKKRIAELEETELGKRVDALERALEGAELRSSGKESELRWLKKRLKKLEAYKAWHQFGRDTAEMTQEQWEAHWAALARMVEQAPTGGMPGVASFETSVALGAPPHFGGGIMPEGFVTESLPVASSELPTVVLTK